MDLEEIKGKMLGYVDFYGNCLLERDSINSCNTKDDLLEIIESHSNHINDMENDAQNNLSRFKRSLNLEEY